MDITGPFILASDIEFIPVATINEKTRNGFEHDAGDIVITKANTRETSKVISQELASILEEFSQPKSMAEVIYSFSLSRKKDPQQLADEVFESLLDMQRWGFIVPYHQKKDRSSSKSLQINERFKGYKVLDKYQQVKDTAVYRVAGEDGNFFALKLLKTDEDSNVGSLLKNEVSILQLLDNSVNPRFIEQGTENGDMFLITEWCDGISCAQEAARYRNSNYRNNLIQLLNLSVSILKAYDHLHKQNVLHGDINPDNILVSRSGTIKIIDYGYAQVIGEPAKVQRGGTGFHYEPEFAICALRNETDPPVTEKAEQYSIAVLLYWLITGHQYLNFSFEREKLFHQVADDEPLRFTNFDIDFPAELFNVLAKALSKDPSDRFDSLSAFAKAMLCVKNMVFENSRFYIFNQQDTDDQFLNFFIQKFGWESPLIEKGFQNPPTCSINYGSSGVAYVYHRIACVKQDATLSDLADVWANRALSFHRNYNDAFYSPAIGITEKIVGKTSLYHSPAGIYLMQAMISNSRNDLHTLRKAVGGFLLTTKSPCDNIDVTLGKAGLLIGCSILYRELMTIENDSISELMSSAEAIKDEIWGQLAQYPSMNEPNPVDYFGIAHGWAGLLYATLLWCDLSSSTLPGKFMRRLEELHGNSIEQENIFRWPLRLGDKNSWPGWCNGNAGYIFLWTLLYKHFKDEKYLQIAEKIAFRLTRGTKTDNSDLCCGMSGVVYAMINLYKTTNEKKYLEKAKEIKDTILKTWFSQPLRNNSLYKGEPGIAAMVGEFREPSLMKMPLFE